MNFLLRGRLFENIRPAFGDFGLGEELVAVAFVEALPDAGGRHLSLVVGDHVGEFPFDVLPLLDLLQHGGTHPFGLEPRLLALLLEFAVDFSQPVVLVGQLADLLILLLDDLLPHSDELFPFLEEGVKHFLQLDLQIFVGPLLDRAHRCEFILLINRRTISHFNHIYSESAIRPSIYTPPSTRLASLRLFQYLPHIVISKIFRFDHLTASSSQAETFEFAPN